MTKELLQQAHDALITSLAYVDATSAIAEVQGALKAIEQALAQQEQPAQEAVAYELEAVKFANGKKLVYQKPENLASYIKVRTLVYADADPAPTQPAQEPVAWYLSEDSNILGVEWSRQKPKYGRDWTPLYKTAPTQPALSDDEIWQFWCNRPEVPEGEDDSMEAEFVAACKRAIEAHCRGGK